MGGLNEVTVCERRMEKYQKSVKECMKECVLDSAKKTMSVLVGNVGECKKKCEFGDRYSG